MALNPANRLGLPQGRSGPEVPLPILILFDPDAPFLMDRFKLRSKSKNTPFDGARMEGKVLGTWVGGMQVFAAEE
jgi:dihydroorotase